jgi:uncharacterized protein YcfJ
VNCRFGPVHTGDLKLELVMPSCIHRPLALARSLHPALGALLLALGCCATPAQAQITFFEHDAYQGRSFTTQVPVGDLQRRGFNDRASSVVVSNGRWEICEDAGFEGRCTVLRPGQYPALADMGLNDRISSMRPVSRDSRVDEQRFAPHPQVTGDYRRRDREQLYEATVSSARAVYGAPEQRCWMERASVTEPTRNDAQVPSGILGAVIGGILGHQVGGGSGRDLATAGGAVAGAVVGSNLARNRDGSTVVTRDVQRCADTPGSARPAYWDVSYEFRGQLHQVQLTSAPGPTITVNRQGEPRA